MPRPGMSDGRSFTSYLPNCQLNMNLQESKNISNNVDYKEYIQKNSKKMLNDFYNTTSVSVQSACLPTTKQQI